MEKNRSRGGAERRRKEEGVHGLSPRCPRAQSRFRRLSDLLMGGAEEPAIVAPAARRLVRGYVPSSRRRASRRAAGATKVGSGVNTSASPRETLLGGIKSEA